MRNSILVTGVTGNVGAAVARRLVESGHRVRAAVRDVEKARRALGDELDYAPFDFDDPETFAAFDGVQKVFLMRPPAVTDTKRLMNPAIDVARAAGVEHIVFLSLQGIQYNPFAPHYHVEKHLEAVGLPYTFLRPSFFMQNLTMPFVVKDVKERGELFLPAGNGKTSFIDVRDIAAVAALTLTEDGHQHKAYTLTGSEALSYGQVAAIMSNVLDRQVKYARPSARQFKARMLSHGLTRDFVDVMSAIYFVARVGLAKSVTPELERLLGRPPITMEQFVGEHAHVWR